MLWNPIPLWRGVLRRRGTGYTYTKPAQIRVHVHLCCCTNNVSRLSHPIKSFIYDSRPFWGGTPLIKKAHRGCDSLVSQNSRLVLHTYIITTTTYTWHPNDCCFNWKRHCFGMLLEASTTKIEDKYLYIYIYIDVHIYTCVSCWYTPCFLFSLPIEVAASTAKAKFESWKPSSVGAHPSGKVNQTIGQCEKTTEVANEASCICILYMYNFFVARSEYVCIYIYIILVWMYANMTKPCKSEPCEWNRDVA